jgi:hypothetical protein
MEREKLTARKHVHASLHRNAVPMESHSDGQNTGYFPRTLRTVLLVLGYSRPHFLSMSQGCFMGTHTFGMCVCDHIREANDWSYSPHLSRGRGYHTEEDVRGRHKRGCTRSFGAATTWSGGTNGVIIIPPLPELRPRRSSSCGDARGRSWPHRVLHRPSEADSCFSLRSWRGHQGGQHAKRARRGVKPKIT